VRWFFFFTDTNEAEDVVMSDNKDDFGTDLKRKKTEKNNISDPRRRKTTSPIRARWATSYVAKKLANNIPKMMVRDWERRWNIRFIVQNGAEKRISQLKFFNLWVEKPYCLKSARRCWNSPSLSLYGSSQLSVLPDVLDIWRDLYW